MEKTIGWLFGATNRLMCLLWNSVVRFIQKTPLPRLFEAQPLLMGLITLFLLVTVLAQFIILFLVLAIFAYFNGAAAKSSYLIPRND